MNLTEFLETVKAPTLRSVEIDLSASAGQPFTITLSELDAPRLFQVQEDADALKKRRSDWPKSLCLAVAVLSQAHTAPAPPQGLTRAEFYVQIAVNSRQLLTRLLTEYGEAFPDSVGDEGAEQAKNDLEEQEAASCSSALPISTSTPGNATALAPRTLPTLPPTTTPSAKSDTTRKRQNK